MQTDLQLLPNSNVLIPATPISFDLVERPHCDFVSMAPVTLSFVVTYFLAESPSDA